MSVWSQYRALLSASLVLRIIFVALALYYGRYIWADSGGLTLEAFLVCGQGEWGGSAYKPPLYAWLQCLCSGGSVTPGVYGHAGIVIILQSAASWLAGFWLLKKYHNKRAAAFWLFDPGLVAYGVMIMTDSLFSVLLMGALMVIVSLHNKTPRRVLILLGVLMGGVMLQRSNGFMAVFFCLLLVAKLSVARKLWFKQVALVVGALCITIAPRVVYSVSHGNGNGFTGQGAGWLRTVVAVSELAPKGYDFFSAETEWMKTSAQISDAQVVERLLRAFPDFAALTLKGTARTLVGHLNVEYSYLLTGTAVIGPGLTRPQEPREGYRISGAELVLWFIGVGAAMAFTGALYLSIALNITRLWVKKKMWPDLATVICVCGGVVMAAMPLVFGDGRFRLTSWPFFIAALLLSDALTNAQPGKNRGSTPRPVQ